MKKNFINILFLIAFFSGSKAYAAKITTFEVDLPMNDKDNACREYKGVMELAKIERRANEFTGYKSCILNLDRKLYDINFSHCYLSGQYFRSLPNRTPEFRCLIDKTNFNGVDIVLFSSSGIVEAGSCEFSCVQL